MTKRRRRHTPEQIIRKLDEGHRQLARASSEPAATQRAPGDLFGRIGQPWPGQHSSRGRAAHLRHHHDAMENPPLFYFEACRY